MTPKRVLLAAVIGGVVMFIWGYVCHMPLKLGNLGVKDLPSEQILVPQLKAAISERGIYGFPSAAKGESGEVDKKSSEQEPAAGPSGLLIYDPSGGEMTAAQLGTEFASNVAAALIAALMLARVGGAWPARAVVGAGLGVVAWLSINVSYWNWDHFPAEFPVEELIEQTVGWLLTGGAIALVLGRAKSVQPAVA